MDRVTGHYPPAQWYAEISHCKKCGRKMDIVPSPEHGLYIWMCSGRKMPRNLPEWKAKRWTECRYSPHMECMADYDAFLRGESREVSPDYFRGAAWQGSIMSKQSQEERQRMIVAAADELKDASKRIKEARAEQ